MTWRDRLQRASFRGVPFYVDSTTGSWGRRVSVQRLAGGRVAVAQDQGAEPQEFDVSAFVWGDDYDLVRNRLEAALCAEGPATLVIPRRGPLTARVTRGPATSESKDEGGFATIRFSVLIEQAPDAALGPDTASEVRAKSQHLRVAAAQDLGDRVSTKGLVARQLDRVGELVRTGTATMARVSRMLSNLTSPVTSLTRDLDAFALNATQLLSTPALFATTAIDLVQGAFTIGDAAVAGAASVAGVPGTLVLYAKGRGARQVDRAAAAFRGLGEPFGVRSSALERQAEDNRTASATVMRAAALSAVADAYASLDFDSATFALSAFTRTNHEIDAVQAAGVGDTLFQALDDLRAALGRHVYETASRLPDTVTIELRRPVPSLLLAHHLYGDAAQAEDIVLRNRVPYPSFIRGRVQVLRP